MKSEKPIRIWALLGDHRGDNNQVLALAEGLGLPFETKELDYRPALKQGLRATAWRWLLRVLPPSLAGLTRQSQATLAGEPPDLLIAIGSRSVPIVRALQRRSRGGMIAVQLGNPRVAPRHFDLVLTTPQYPVRDAPNVVRLPIALGRAFARPPHNEATRDFLARLPAPRRLLLLGGPTGSWDLDPADVANAIASLLDDCKASGGSLIVLASPRTPDSVFRAADKALANALVPAALAPTEGPPRYAELLDAADRIFVTADSVAMTSEAIRTGKPVGLVPVRLADRAKGRIARHDARHPGRPIQPRDLRHFWAELQARALVGTVAQPTHGADPDVNRIAVARVMRLLDIADPPARDSRDSVRSTPANPAAHARA